MELISYAFMLILTNVYFLVREIAMIIEFKDKNIEGDNLEVSISIFKHRTASMYFYYNDSQLIF